MYTYVSLLYTHACTERFARSQILSYLLYFLYTFSIRTEILFDLTLILACDFYNTLYLCSFSFLIFIIKFLPEILFRSPWFVWVSPVPIHLGHFHSVRWLLFSLIMSLWRDRTRLQELLQGFPRVVVGGVEAQEEDTDDRAMVIFIDEAVEAVEETAAAVEDAGHHETLAMILGSVAALVVAGSVLYVILSRVLPVQTRRIEAAAWTAATTVVQVKLIKYFFFGSLILFVFHINFPWFLLFLLCFFKPNGNGTGYVFFIHTPYLHI